MTDKSQTTREQKLEDALADLVSAAAPIAPCHTTDDEWAAFYVAEKAASAVLKELSCDG